MKLPFADLFRKATSRFFQASVPAPTQQVRRPRPIEKAADQKLSKTVLPNSTRSSHGSDPFKSASSAPSIKIAAAADGPVLLKRDLPPAVALAMQPKVERAISLQLSDVLEQVPSGYVKSPEMFDSSQRITLKASEIEKGMAEGKPTVSLATIYEQVPEIFQRTLPSGLTAHVPLPYPKVLEQFRQAQVRSDQLSEQAVPQLETPILQVTMEDKERFGTTMDPLQASPLPPVKIEPATARTISTAEPEPVVKEKVAASPSASRVIPLSTPLMAAPVPPRPAEPPGAAEPPSAPQPAAGTPTRIPFQFPPSGMGGSASERVPASGGPPIPTGDPKKTTPARVPFRTSPPCDDLRPKLTLVPGLEPAAAAAPALATEVLRADGPKIKLALLPIMQNVPAFQLTGSVDKIPADACVEFPFSSVEPQLATGRVAIEAKTFQAALPDPYREIFVVDAAEAPVLLPLQEVLKNLPSTALKMREDQEEVEAGGSFETPFSIKAKEDEKRFSVSSSPISKTVQATPVKASGEVARTDPAVTPPVEKAEPAELELSATPPKSLEASLAPAAAAEPAPEPKIALKLSMPTSTPESKAPEQEAATTAEPVAPVDIKGRKEKNEAKDLVARANALPGVSACCLTFADGLALAGNLPAEAAADGLCAMAPSLLQRIEKYLLDTKLGSLAAVTLNCEKSPITFVMQGNICLSVLHADRNLPSETQNELATITKELSRTYAQPETN